MSLSTWLSACALALIFANLAFAVVDPRLTHEAYTVWRVKFHLAT